MICKHTNVIISGLGCLTMPLKDEKLEFKLPENVIKAKIHGIKADIPINWSVKKKPIIRQAGMKKAIIEFIILLID